MRQEIRSSVSATLHRKFKAFADYILIAASPKGGSAGKGAAMRAEEPERGPRAPMCKLSMEVHVCDPGARAGLGWEAETGRFSGCHQLSSRFSDRPCLKKYN